MKLYRPVYVLVPSEAKLYGPMRGQDVQFFRARSEGGCGTATYHEPIAFTDDPPIIVGYAPHDKALTTVQLAVAERLKNDCQLTAGDYNSDRPPLEQTLWRVSAP
jgi:hypothetical protein